MEYSQDREEGQEEAEEKSEKRGDGGDGQEEGGCGVNNEGGEESYGQRFLRGGISDSGYFNAKIDEEGGDD